jgi:predicted negative regulator of RcsB-dependent stress response
MTNNVGIIIGVVIASALAIGSGYYMNSSNANKPSEQYQYYNPQETVQVKPFVGGKRRKRKTKKNKK